MSQNRSSAVMAQRREPKDSLDLFPTPPWATRALCEWINHYIGPVSKQRVWEPASGLGHMVSPLTEYFQLVRASDVYPHDEFTTVHDFLMPGEPLGVDDWIITNPPFRLATEFVERALSIATKGVAMLVRTAFLEGQDRYETLFKKTPPVAIVQFTERVIMLKGRLARLGGIDPLTGEPTATATSYCWIVWLAKKTILTPSFYWIPPCRKRLERASDYAEAA